MERNRFVVLALIAFGCVLASFTTLGFGRLLVGYRTGLLLAAPFGLLAFVLVVVLFAISVWTVLTGGLQASDDGTAESGSVEDR
jgi:membrane protein implicated in regulation of membrane protease activity